MEKKRKYTFDCHQRWEKILRILRASLLIALITTMYFDVNATAQVIKVTVKMENATIDEMIKTVRTETNYRFLYRVEEVNKYGKRNIDLQNVSIDDFLKTLLSGTKLSYEIEDDVIIIRPADDNKKETEKPRTIKGKVLDDKGFTLPGATVTIKGTTLGVVTDVDGKFKLEIPKMDSIILVISFIGFETQSYKVSNDPKNDENEIVIKLQEDVKQMDEVVVTGYANIKKESFTGSSVSVKRDELLKVSKTNVIKALQVFDPSFRLQENNQWGSDPNTLPEMYIRGRSGTGVKELDPNYTTKANLENNPNLPLFIMDGFQVSIQKVYDFDPNRIESMTILKDAAATAMYGSRAANGVVAITTVAPKPGKINVSYSMTGTLSIPDLSDYNLMNAKEKLATEVAANVFKADPSDSYYEDNQAKLDREYQSKLNNIIEGVDTYWLSKPLRTVFNHKHSIFLEGGHEDLRFGLNLTYANNDGIMKESSRNNAGVEFSIDYRLGNFQIKDKIVYQQTKSKESPYGSFSEYTKKLPYDKYKDENGNYLPETTQWNSELSQTDIVNPLWEATLASFDRTKENLLENELGINWFITPHLLAKGTFKVTQTISEGKKFVDPKSKRNTNPLSVTNLTSGSLTQRDGKSASWEFTANLSYNRSIENHNINFNLGMNGSSTDSKSTTTIYEGFPSGIFSSPSYAEKVREKPSNSKDVSHLIGFIGLLNYSYNDIYLLDASIRTDGSSKFGHNKKWALYWSGGVGVNLHNYDFVKNIGWLNLLKLRTSYGLTGNVSFSPYEAQTMYETIDDEWYKTGYGATLIALGNEDLGWEKKYKTNFGIDFEIFKGILNLSADYYIEKTVDMVNDVTIPSSTGFTTYKDNIGEVKGKGYEIILKSSIVNKTDWNFNVYFNLAHDKRKFVKIAESLKAYNQKVEDHFNDKNTLVYNSSIGNNSISEPFKQYVEGGSLTPIYAVRSLGIDPTNGKEIFVKKNGEITYTWNASDQVALGDSEPDIQGSFGFNLRYKSWTLFTSFMYKYGGQYYNSTLVEKVEDANIYKYNVDKRILKDRWQKPGDRAKYKSLADGMRSEKTQPTERFIQNENVVSLNSLSLSYDFDPTLLKRIGVSMLRLELGANDLFRLSTVKAERGLSYPFARSMNITLNATF